MTLTVTSCDVNDSNNCDDPLIVVIKLISAETVQDYKVALKLMDVESVYGKWTKGRKENAEEVWKKNVNFTYSVGKTKKFSNNFPYHKFDITESIDENTATVRFKKIDNYKEIIYTLHRNNDGDWIVTGLDFKKGK